MNNSGLKYLVKLFAYMEQYISEKLFRVIRKTDNANPSYKEVHDRGEKEERGGICGTMYRTVDPVVSR